MYLVSGKKQPQSLEKFVLSNVLGILVYGKPYTVQLCLEKGIHFLSDDITIEYISNDIQKDIQKDIHRAQNVYLSCHHRATLHQVELYAQYMFNSLFDTYFITTLKTCFVPVLSYTLGYINIRSMKSEERYWTLVTELQNSSKKALSVFPDRSGSLHYGYTKHYFRDGVFAASLFTGIPIIDILIFEPKANKPSTTIEIRLWTPNAFQCTDTHQVHNASDYTAWRHLNSVAIQAYTKQCETEYKSRIQELEEQYSSCDVDALEPNKICTSKHIEYDWNEHRDEFVAKKNASKSIP